MSASEEAVRNAQWNAAAEAALTEQQRRAPHVLMRPRVFLDGNAWCALYGEDLQAGVSGFGATPAEACHSFDLTWLKGSAPVVQPDFEAMLRKANSWHWQPESGKVVLDFIEDKNAAALWSALSEQ